MCISSFTSIMTKTYFVINPQINNISLPVFWDSCCFYIFIDLKTILYYYSSPYGMVIKEVAKSEKFHYSRDHVSKIKRENEFDKVWGTDTCS